MLNSLIFSCYFSFPIQSESVTARHSHIPVLPSDAFVTVGSGGGHGAALVVPRGASMVARAVVEALNVRPGGYVPSVGFSSQAVALALSTAKAAAANALAAAVASTAAAAAALGLPPTDAPSIERQWGVAVYAAAVAAAAAFASAPLPSDSSLTSLAHTLTAPHSNPARTRAPPSALSSMAASPLVLFEANVDSVLEALVKHASSLPLPARVEGLVAAALPSLPGSLSDAATKPAGQGTSRGSAGATAGSRGRSKDAASADDDAAFAAAMTNHSTVAAALAPPVRTNYPSGPVTPPTAAESTIAAVAAGADAGAGALWWTSSAVTVPRNNASTVYHTSASTWPALLARVAALRSAEAGAAAAAAVLGLTALSAPDNAADAAGSPAAAAAAAAAALGAATGAEAGPLVLPPALVPAPTLVADATPAVAYYGPLDPAAPLAYLPAQVANAVERFPSLLADAAAAASTPATSAALAERSAAATAAAVEAVAASAAADAATAAAATVLARALRLVASVSPNGDPQEEMLLPPVTAGALGWGTGLCQCPLALPCHRATGGAAAAPSASGASAASCATPVECSCPCGCRLGKRVSDAILGTGSGVSTTVSGSASSGSGTTTLIHEQAHANHIRYCRDSAVGDTHNDVADADTADGLVLPPLRMGANAGWFDAQPLSLTARMRAISTVPASTAVVTGKHDSGGAPLWLPRWECEREEDDEELAWHWDELGADEATSSALCGRGDHGEAESADADETDCGDDDCDQEGFCSCCNSDCGDDDDGDNNSDIDDEGFDFDGSKAPNSVFSVDGSRDDSAIAAAAEPLLADYLHGLSQSFLFPLTPAPASLTRTHRYRPAHPAASAAATAAAAGTASHAHAPTDCTGSLCSAPAHGAHGAASPLVINTSANDALCSALAPHPPMFLSAERLPLSTSAAADAVSATARLRLRCRETWAQVLANQRRERREAAEAAAAAAGAATAAGAGGAGGLAAAAAAANARVKKQDDYFSLDASEGDDTADLGHGHNAGGHAVAYGNAIDAHENGLGSGANGKTQNKSKYQYPYELSTPPAWLLSPLVAITPSAPAALAALRSLNLSSNPLGDAGAVALAGFLSDPSASSSLQHLNIISCKILSRGMLALMRSLGCNNALQELVMCRNAMTADAGRVLGDALTVNAALRRLDMGQMNITARAARGLAPGLARNRGLTELNLNENELEGLSAAVIMRAVEMGDSIKVLHLADNGITEEV